MSEWRILLVCLIYQGHYRSLKGLTGAAEGESRREEERRWLEEQIKEQRNVKEEQERQRQEEARRKVIEDAKKQFEEAVMGGRFPSEEVLAILADCDSEIPINLKEAVEELLYGRCSLHSMAFGDAVCLIQQRQRTNERAKKRAARGEGHRPSRPGQSHKLRPTSCLASVRDARRRNWQGRTTGRCPSGTRTSSKAWQKS